MTKPVCVALISGVPPLRNSMARGLSAYGVQIVSREMQDLSRTNFLNMLKKRPDIILILDGIPKTPEGKKNFERFQAKVERESSARILIRTELFRNDPSLEEVRKNGISIVDASTNPEQIARLMRSLMESKEPLERFEDHKRIDLESAKFPVWEKRNHGEFLRRPRRTKEAI